MFINYWSYKLCHSFRVDLSPVLIAIILSASFLALKSRGDDYYRHWLIESVVNPERVIYIDNTALA